MSDVLLRRLAILKSIPVYPRKVSTRQLFSYLENNGYSTTIRTIQRDLEYLSGSGIFGIGVDSDSKPAGWYWLKESKTVTGNCPLLVWLVLILITLDTIYK